MRDVVHPSDRNKYTHVLSLVEFDMSFKTIVRSMLYKVCYVCNVSDSFQFQNREKESVT